MSKLDKNRLKQSDIENVKVMPKVLMKNDSLMIICSNLHFLPCSHNTTTKPVLMAIGQACDIHSMRMVNVLVHIEKDTLLVT